MYSEESGSDTDNVDADKRPAGAGGDDAPVAPPLPASTSDAAAAAPALPESGFERREKSDSGDTDDSIGDDDWL
eukprot:SAG22_NODE_1456_length_4385_cov_12.667289_4_plen_74_part_00